MIYQIKSDRIITPDGFFDGYILFDEKIISLTKEKRKSDVFIDATNKIVSPGFIDIHLHGGMGYDYSSCSASEAAKAVNFHLQHGTTTQLPTITSSNPIVTKNALNNLNECITDNLSNANLPGVHLEGPYFSKKQCGAQSLEYITPPNKQQYEELVSSFSKLIKRWSFAPELDGSVDFCRFLVKNNIIASIGHSDAIYQECKAVMDCGCNLITHLFSCTSTITRENGYRRLGIIETAFLSDDLFVEIIADGKHLPLELIKLIYKIKDKSKICLVTDCIGATGSSTATATVGDVKCIIEDGVAKLPDRTAFAGSIATSDRLVKTCLEAGIPLLDAVNSITKNPAELLSLKTGSFVPEYDSDVLIFDDKINIINVFVKGNKIK